jgi:hypothetical protein
MLSRFLSHASVPCVMGEGFKDKNIESEKFF